jgi:hypothetical protein
VATRDIRTFHEAVACDVCGRTLLRGERAETWLAGGSRREVCELCSARARHEGWIREDARLEVTERSPAGERRASLLGRLRQRRGRPAREREPAPPPAEEEYAPDELEAEDLAPEPAPAPAPAPRRTAPPPAPAPAEPAGEPRSVHAVPSSAEQRVREALETFNGTEHVRTVAGVARSLGEATVAAEAIPGTQRVKIVVSWELCWYRYEIDLSDEAAAVEQTAQGYELEELEEPERLPSAVADEHGRLHPAG